MSLEQVRTSLNLFGQTAPEPASATLQGGLEPQLDIPWGGFRQSLGSSSRALFTTAPKEFASGGFFKDSWIERRIPRRALIAAALWHIAFLAMPFANLLVPRRNPALKDFELTWSGPIEDLPLIEIPRARARPSPRAEPNKPRPAEGADAFHPRQRIFTDPVRPTHSRQTLINPKSPLEAPKLLPNLPNIVQLQESIAPPKPRLLISEETLKKLHPRELRAKKVAAAPAPDVPAMDQQQVADLNIPVVLNGPARPKLEINAGSGPRAAQRTEAGNAEPAPEIRAAEPSAAHGSANALIALSANPGPPAPIQPPQGNLAARISISPEGKQASVPGGTPNGKPSDTGGAANAKDGEGTGNGAGNPVGVSISGGNPPAANGASGLGSAARLGASSPRKLITRPDPKVADDVPDRVGPPNFSALPPEAKPEAIFAAKRVYTLNVNMPNLNSSTGSWILNFSELRSNPDAPHVTSPDLTGPVPMKKVDPKYPPSLIGDRVAGEVVLYAVIRADGSIDNIQLVHGIDEQLDENAMSALSQWKFRPATKQGTPVELEAIVHIPFHLPPNER